MLQAGAHWQQQLLTVNSKKGISQITTRYHAWEEIKSLSSLTLINSLIKNLKESQILFQMVCFMI